MGLDLFFQIFLALLTLVICLVFALIGFYVYVYGDGGFYELAEYHSEGGCGSE